MITIKNYNSDVNLGVFYGWDMKYAMEDFVKYEANVKERNTQKNNEVR